ncbi:pumilio homolog 3-like [Diadema setosum]|uniref:pumilio homolog 3-like n=1 Tax=Diadema setosum TaxID=31175 RepID=UPI003B3AD1FE
MEQTSVKRKGSKRDSTGPEPKKHAGGLSEGEKNSKSSKTKQKFAKATAGKGGRDSTRFQKPAPKRQEQKNKWKAGEKRKKNKDGNSEGTKRPKMEEMKKKERRQVRRQVKNNFELAKKAKASWEIIRQHDCKAETRKKHISELCELLKGRVMELMKAHDSVRVIQCCVQFGTPEQRTQIFDEVKDDIVELAKSKYAKFFVLKMLRYGTREQRAFIMRAFHGKVCQLIRHSEAAEVVEEAYNNHANAQDRSALMEEFYGARFAVFKASGIHTLDDILEKDPTMRQSILEHMLKILTPLLDKAVIKHTMVHKAIYDFLVHAPEKMRGELIESLREVVVQILHTLDGARAAMYCLWFGTAKDRKIIIKSFKTYVTKIAKEEFGHRVLLALFDSVDDTKIVGKVIIEELMKSAYEVATDQYGRKVLFYLLVPRDPSHFHPDIVKQLQKGDDNPVSKKDRTVRRKELLEAASPALLKLLLTHTKEMAYSKSNSQLALAILEHAQGDKSSSFAMFATLAAEDLVPILVNNPSRMDEMHLVEHPSGHFLVRRLLAFEKSQREKEGAELKSTLSDCLLEELSDENIRSWARVNRGAFVLASLADCGNEDATERIRTVMQEWGKGFAKLSSKGVVVLREKLQMD